MWREVKANTIGSGTVRLNDTAGEKKERKQQQEDTKI
jgi:hypothetical protein